MHTQPIAYLARAAAETTLSSVDLRRLRIQLVADAGAALGGLLVTTILAIYKPPGRTRYGWGKQREDTALSPQGSSGPSAACPPAIPGDHA